MLRSVVFVFIYLALNAVGLTAEGDKAPRKLTFNQDIRPILSDKCFHCHGPDKNKRDSGLRLDVREDAIADRDGIRAIVPGKPQESEAYLRMTTDDHEEIMPPPKAKLPRITPAESEVIKRWISEGAEYEKHWAFNSLRPVDAPGIDPLIEKGISAHGLKMQPEADRNTLIRRVSFDITGLPPTPAEIETFVSDAAPNAYEKLVDRLLSSPRYGERMAVDWLDVARYADSYGFQQDAAREVWPWRDWVIRSFNANQRFDEFITWQLAGDLLPNPTDDQVMATAFNRMHQQENEGGSVEEEYRVEYVADRVQTFATAFLGLTFECTRCHDHKFDPILQKEYYQLFAFFQNVDEAGLYSFFTSSVPTPALRLADAPTKQRLAAVEAKAAEEKTKLDALLGSRRADFEKWLGARPTELKLPGEIGAYAFDSAEKKQLANSVPNGKPAAMHGENKLVPGYSGQAVQFSGDDAVDLPFGNFNRFDPFAVTLWLKTPDVKDRAVVFHRSKAWTDAGSRGYELLIEDGKLKWSLIHFWPGNAVSIRTKDAVPLNTWTHVAVTSDGSSRAAGLRLFVNGKEAAVEVVKDALTREITGGGGDNIALGERFRDRGFKGGQIDDFRVFSRELTPIEVLATTNRDASKAAYAKAASALSTQERSALERYYFSTVDPEYARQLEAVKTARAEVQKFSSGIREIMVMKELPQPKKAYILERGEYNHRGAEVFVGTPAVLSPWPNGTPKNRLGLAKWLTEPNHPLTARVLVNRFWLNIFGRGLVKTVEDFGSQSALPLYPEVLDWLANRYIQGGWNTKELIKTMVMSRVYRQRSVADEKTMADDPENEWLARGPRFRLSAEMIRDNALAAAGLLSSQAGGPPVNAYEMTESFKPEGPSGGDGVHRRSVYSKWRRTGPPPAMIAFDAARRAVCTAKRERTDSPLQALVLLNGTQYVEAARVLGETLHRDANGDVNQMVEQGFLRCLSRKPDAKEREICAQLYREQLAYFHGKPAEAGALLKAGVAKAVPGIPAAEAAAAAMLAQTLMNHDASVVKR